jgi:hypothetical protein
MATLAVPEKAALGNLFQPFFETAISKIPKVQMRAFGEV